MSAARRLYHAVNHWLDQPVAPQPETLFAVGQVVTWRQIRYVIVDITPGGAYCIQPLNGINWTLSRQEP